MASMTLLGVVQSYFNATDGWSVNSISDTVEAEQVSLIAQEVFYEVVNDITDWKFKQKLTQLESVADNTKPNYLRIPDNFRRVKYSVINYDKRTGNSSDSAISYSEVCYLPPEDFMRDIINIRSTQVANTVQITDYSGVKLLIKNNSHPTYCTSFDDEYLVFDSWDDDLEDTLQASKSQVIVNVERPFSITNDYVIDLPDDFIPTYLSLVKSRASEYLRQEPLFTDARRGRAGMIKYRKTHQKIGVTGRQPSLKKFGR